MNKTYLKNRNLDREGQLYQAGKDFDWERHPEAIRLATDPDYNEEQFQRYLEIDGSKEHDKVIYLLDAVNDPKISMEDVVARYFDEQNLYYWMAFHILMGNQDVLDGNYYLYSPRGVDRWYFISWDNDGVLREGYEFLRDQTYDRSWNYGIFTYAGTALFRRILQEDSCRQALDAAVEDLYQNVLTVEKVEKKIREYAAVVKEYLYQLPDRTFARVTEEDYEVLVDSMAGEIAENYERYRESLTSVWPFHILEPTAADGAVTLRWEEAYQYGGGAAAYTAELARIIPSRTAFWIPALPKPVMRQERFPPDSIFCGSGRQEKTIPFRMPMNIIGRRRTACAAALFVSTCRRTAAWLL